MVKRNPHFAKLQSGYLFPEINKRKRAFLAKYPHAKLISLGIGDTSQPLPEDIAAAFKDFANQMQTAHGYRGYGPEQGKESLRKKISESIYNSKVSPDDIFISDGAKCDIGRIQLMFGPEATIAVQDPAYPVYVDTSVMIGQTQEFCSHQKQYKGLAYLPCLPENDFFSDLKNAPRTDLIYFCSPNNPTGAVATRKQLTDLVAFAKKNRSIIVYDSAYSMFIQDANLPKSIFEIEGADEVAIEVGSFSKMAGFTGLRLGWVCVPSKVTFDDGSVVKKDWDRIHTTFFNGASNIVQHGGEAVFSETGQKAVKEVIQYYMQNAELISNGLRKMGVDVFGGKNAPYVWANFKKPSWEMFERLLNEAHVVTTPGSGFGEAGEGFLRFSAFGNHADTFEAMQRLTKIISK